MDFPIGSEDGEADGTGWTTAILHAGGREDGTGVAFGVPDAPPGGSCGGEGHRIPARSDFCGDGRPLICASTW